MKKYFLTLLLLSICFCIFASSECSSYEAHQLYNNLRGRQTDASSAVYSMLRIGRSDGDLPLFSNSQTLQMSERKREKKEVCPLPNKWAVSEIEVSYTSNKGKAVTIQHSRHAAPVFKQMWDPALIELQEQVAVLFLNKASRVIGLRTIATGAADSCNVDIKLIVGIALKCMAQSIILAHNHPSGNLRPSDADFELTDNVRRACAFFGIQLFDHLIITKDDYESINDCFDMSNLKKQVEAHVNRKQQIEKDIAMLRSVPWVGEPEEEEIWKDIPEYEGLYQVSNLGRVKSLERKVKKWDGIKTVREKILSQNKTPFGHLKVIFSKENKHYHPSVHRLLAMAFIPNPQNFPVINHINGNPADNRIENLEWTTQSKNVLHGFKMGRKVTHSVPVLQYTLAGVFVREFESMEDGGRNTPAHPTKIRLCVQNKRKTAGGFIWKLKEVV